MVNPNAGQLVAGRQSEATGVARPSTPESDDSAYLAESERYQILAEDLYSRKMYAEAEVVVRALLDLQERVRGRQHPDYATGLSMLGELRFLQNDGPGAEPILREALATRRATLGTRHPDYAASLSCLAGVLSRRDDQGEVERLLREAHAVRAAAFGANHPATVGSLKELTRCLRRRGDLAGAESLLRPPAPPRREPIQAAAPPLARPACDPIEDGPDGVTELSLRLAAVAEQLRAAQVAPPADAVSESSASRRDFLWFRDRAVRRAQTLSLPLPPPERLDTMRGVTELLDVVSHEERRREERETTRLEALAILERVLALSATEERATTPLFDCQERARAMREAIAQSAWSSLPDDANGLARGDHSFVYLLALVEQRATLSDERWAILHELVGAAFGESLASAASRGRLRSPRSEVLAEHVEPITEAPAEAPLAPRYAGTSARPGMTDDILTVLRTTRLEALDFSGPIRQTLHLDPPGPSLHDRALAGLLPPSDAEPEDDSTGPEAPDDGARNRTTPSISPLLGGTRVIGSGTISGPLSLLTGNVEGAPVIYLGSVTVGAGPGGPSRS